MRLRGSSSNGTGAHVKTRRPLEYKLRVIQLKVNEHKPVHEAFRIAKEEFSLPSVKSMVVYPHAIYCIYAAEINRKLREGHPRVRTLVQEFGVAEDD